TPMAIRPFRRAVLAVLVPCLLPSFMAAQQPPTTIAPIEVVATRRAEAPHEVPASIEVISGDNLRARGAATLRDALSLAAGIAIAPGGDGGPASAVPEFWGLREFDAFLLVIDGIPWGGALNPAIASLNLNDVERIEVLRGPAPVTYGATSFVGVINIVHRAAAATSRSLTVRGGSYGTGGLAADLGIAMSGGWNSRVSADLDRTGFKDDRTAAQRGHLLWRTARTDGARNTWFQGDLTLLRQDPASPHPRAGPVLSTDVPIDANHNPEGAFLDETRIAVSTGLTRPVGERGALWSSMASVTRSSQSMFRGFLTDLSNSADNATGFKETIEITDLYADTHILWPADAKVRFVTGADLLFANGEAKGAVFDYTAPLDGSTAAAVTEPTVLDRDAENRRLFLGVYGSAEWRPTDRVTFSAGVRLNQTGERRGESAPSANNTKLSGTVGALFGLWEGGSDHLRAFANVQSTFKPAAFDFGLEENEGILKPETSMSYEGGFKARLADGRLDVEASAFRMDFENLVTATVVNNLPALINAGTTRFQGFELATDARLRDGLSARATYSFHDGKFVDFVQAFDGVPTQLAGKRFEMSARHLVSAGLTWWPASGLTLNGNLNYTGDRYLTKRNSAKADPFLTLDAGVGYRTGRAEFRLDGRNLSDRRDAVSESEFGDSQYYRMTARSFVASVTLRY
ncbi:MAG: TonB-dependent receptor, partial [Gemmatimonadales bacterium]